MPTILRHGAALRPHRCAGSISFARPSFPPIPPIARRRTDTPKIIPAPYYTNKVTETKKRSGILHRTAHSLLVFGCPTLIAVVWAIGWEQPLSTLVIRSESAAARRGGSRRICGCLYRQLTTAYFCG